MTDIDWSKIPTKEEYERTQRCEEEKGERKMRQIIQNHRVSSSSVPATSTKRHSEETKKKISDSLKGKPLSGVRRENISEGMRRHHAERRRRLKEVKTHG